MNRLNTAERRGFHEVQTLREEWSEVTLRYNSDGQQVIYVQMNKHGRFSKATIIQFALSPAYPFRPPRVRVNYSDYLGKSCCTSSKRISQILKTLGGNRILCLCCDTMLCSSNWTPAFTLADVVNEIHGQVLLRQKVKYMLFLSYLAEKHRFDENVERYIITFLC